MFLDFHILFYIQNNYQDYCLFFSHTTRNPRGKLTMILQYPIDYMFPNSNLVAFGSAIFAFDAYRQGGNTAISVQGGMGIQF